MQFCKGYNKFRDKDKGKINKDFEIYKSQKKKNNVLKSSTKVKEQLYG